MPLSEAAQRYGPCSNYNPPTLSSGAGPGRSPVTSRCQATTRKGTQCSRRATRGAYCWQHAK